MSRLEPTLEPERLARRIEVITGGDGRRRWTVDEKARIVAETLDPGAVVSVIARRYGLTSQQLFAWRREARKRTASAADLLPGFVPAVVDLAEPPTATRSRKRAAAAAIEPEIAGVTTAAREKKPCGEAILAEVLDAPSIAPRGSARGGGLK